MSYSRKKLELTGQRYGRLVVLRQAENIGKRTAWLCRCDCGNEVVVKTRYLRSGHVKSCGCKRAEGIGSHLNYIDGTCVEMLRTKTMRSNGASAVPGADGRTSKRCRRASSYLKGKSSIRTATTVLM